MLLTFSLVISGISLAFVSCWQSFSDVDVYNQVEYTTHIKWRTQMNIESQVKMFGVRVEDLDVLIRHRSKHSTPATICMSMLSDAQEMIERDMKEQARQTINCVKYILSEHVK